VARGPFGAPEAMIKNLKAQVFPGHQFDGNDRRQQRGKSAVRAGQIEQIELVPGMRLEREPCGLYPIWRDPETQLGFQEYTRDMPVNKSLYFCYLGQKIICRIEATEIGGKLQGPYYVKTVSMPRATLKQQTIQANLPDPYKNRSDWFESFQPIMIEGWQLAHTCLYGENQKLAIQLSDDTQRALLSIL